MLKIDLIIMLIAFYSIVILCIGYLMAPKPKKQSDEDESNYMYMFPSGSDVLHDTPVVVRKPILRKPGGIFADPVPSGPVQRPTAQQIKKWHEDELKKGSDTAMNETFSGNRDFMMARQFVESRKT